MGTLEQLAKLVTGSDLAADAYKDAEIIMKCLTRFIAVGLMASGAAGAWAAAPAKASDYQASQVQGANPAAGANGPEVVIRHGEDKTFYEYRVNGVLKEIKVVPSIGKPYYLVPADGGGWIEQDKSQLLVPSWVIFKW